MAGLFVMGKLYGRSLGDAVLPARDAFWYAAIFAGRPSSTNGAARRVVTAFSHPSLVSVPGAGRVETGQ